MKSWKSTGHQHHPFSLYCCQNGHQPYTYILSWIIIIAMSNNKKKCQEIITNVRRIDHNHGTEQVQESKCVLRKERYFIAYHNAVFSVQSRIQFFSLLRHIIPQTQLRCSRHNPPLTYLLFLSPEKCKQFNTTARIQADFSLLPSKSWDNTIKF